MPKKITIASGLSLIILVILVAILTVKANSKGKFDIPRKVYVYFSEKSEIVQMNYEDFLAGCVCGLLDGLDIDKLESEAVKAAVIAENSRMLYHLNEKSQSNSGRRNTFGEYGADFSVNYDFPYIENTNEKIKQEVRRSSDRFITYEDEPINAPMCCISTGRTDSAPPYSPSLDLACDENAEGFKSICAYTPDEVRNALYKGGELTNRCGEWLHDPVYADSGTLNYMEFGDTRITGTSLKRALRLRSTAVSANYSEDKFYFTCRGLGENSGMSISAASYYAKQGNTAENIIKLFYPDCVLQ